MLTPNLCLLQVGAKAGEIGEHDHGFWMPTFNFHQNAVDFATAERECNLDGGHLAYYSSLEEQKEVGLSCTLHPAPPAHAPGAPSGAAEDSRQSTCSGPAPHRGNPCQPTPHRWRATSSARACCCQATPRATGWAWRQTATPGPTLHGCLRPSLRQGLAPTATGRSPLPSRTMPPAGTSAQQPTAPTRQMVRCAGTALLGCRS